MLRTVLHLAKSCAVRILGNMRGAIIGPYARAVLADSRNGLLLVPAGDFMVGRRLCFTGEYDWEMIDLISQKCMPLSEVLVVGAHVGALVIPLAKKAHKVVAIEANPGICELLRMNVELNGLKNVEVYAFAAGDTDASSVEFAMSRLNTGGSGVVVGDWEKGRWLYGRPKIITVEMKRLDSVFSNSRFDLILMDIEGAEPMALRGMPRLLADCRVLVVEVFERHLRRVAKVGREEFLSLVEPFFDGAVILPEKPGRRHPRAMGPYERPAFQKMMVECLGLKEANIMFWKHDR